jgi:hypothetical protein
MADLNLEHLALLEPKGHVMTMKLPQAKPKAQVAIMALPQTELTTQVATTVLPQAAPTSPIETEIPWDIQRMKEEAKKLDEEIKLVGVPGILSDDSIFRHEFQLYSTETQTLLRELIEAIGRFKSKVEEGEALFESLDKEDKNVKWRDSILHFYDNFVTMIVRFDVLWRELGKLMCGSRNLSSMTDSGRLRNADSVLRTGGGWDCDQRCIQLLWALGRN